MAEVPDLPSQSTVETLPELDPTKKQKNWAEVDTVAVRIKREIIPLLDLIRSRRQILNQTWQSYLRIWDLMHEDQGYLGRSNIFMPSGRKVVDTTCAQLVSGTFPGDDNFGVSAYEPERDQDALYVKAVLRQQIDNVARVRVWAEVHYRQLAIAGNSPCKIYYDRKTVQSIRRKREMFGRPAATEHVLYDGPRFEPIDIQNVYYFPEEVTNPDDAAMVFEDLTTTMGNLRRKAADKLYYSVAVEAAGESARQSEKDQAANANQEAIGMSSVHDVEGYGAMDLTELYMNFDPLSEKLSEEKNPVPFKIVICNGEVLQAIRNPFWHQRPPYRLGRMSAVVNRVYATGVVDSIRNLVLLLNDQVNQGMDAATFALNPIVLKNPNLVFGTLADIEPGVEWEVMDVNEAVKFLTPDGAVINNMSVLTTTTNGWINDYSNAPPVLQGGSSPGRAFRTATGIQAASQNARVPLQEIIRLNEAEVFEPMLWMFHCLNEQFAQRDYLIYMNGGKQPPTRIMRHTLAGDWCFKWLASTQTDNKMLKGSQLQELIALLTQAPVQQNVAAQSVVINLVPLIRQLCEEVYGQRNVDSFLVQQVANQLGAGPNLAGALGAAAGGVPGSGATPPGAAPTTGNENLDETRMGSDLLSSMMGGMNMPGGVFPES